jgi:lipoprotein-anchoring transpeptidase ErfK/SrfK
MLAMRQKSFILVAVLLLVLVGGAVAAYAYDSSRDDVIAKGVTVAGVDVGGMRVSEARLVIARELRAPLERPISVVHAGRHFSLSARDAGIRADVTGMVGEALSNSRSGNIISRVTRDLTGGEENAQVPARVTYDAQAVDGLVKRVSRSLDRPAQDAQVDFPSLDKVKERKGIQVKAAVLTQRLAQALTVPGVARHVKAPVRITRPKVTQAELAGKYPVLLIADRNNFKLRLYKQLQLVKEYTVAVGAIGFDTPAGLYHIQNKQVDPTWNVPNSAWAGDLAGKSIPAGPDNPLKARWMGIFDGAGIHGTDETYSLGHAASHGCLRMAIPDVIELYDQVPVGAPIYIE